MIMDMLFIKSQYNDKKNNLKKQFYITLWKK